MSAIQNDILLAGLHDTEGNPLNGGKVYTYAVGTITPKACWLDQGKVNVAANPIILDTNGQAQIYWEGWYKFVVTDANDVVVNTWDIISALLQVNGFTWRGQWVCGQNYQAYDVLFNAGVTYICILTIPTSTTAPGSDSTHFQTFPASTTVQSYQSYVFGTDTGTANAYNVAVISALGTPIYFIAANSNTGPSTLTTSSLSTIPIKKYGTSALSGGEIIAGQIIGVAYDGTNFQLIQGGGTMLRRVFLGTSGTWVVPPGVTAVWLSGCAGGGGGDGGSGGGNGGGGGASGTLRIPVSVNSAETITVTIGAGGLGYTESNEATDGGDTVVSGSFGTFTMDGGKKGHNAGGGDGGLNPGTGATSCTGGNGGDCYETSFRVCGAGGGGGGGGTVISGSKGGKSGWGYGLCFGAGGGGGSSPFGQAQVGAHGITNSGTGGCGGNWTIGTNGYNGGSGRVIFEYWN